MVTGARWAGTDPEEQIMIIDCDQCQMQDTTACRDCVVGSLLHTMAGPIELDEDQADALDILAEHGLVPELRLVPRTASG